MITLNKEKKRVSDAAVKQPRHRVEAIDAAPESSLLMLFEERDDV
jgi:hypothetical protein